ncbi:MAG TPA: ORF6N domain-containing protein [Kofleriaceae bacterium]|nr:ORF6N domain-containing protein [Kofleriaceae bacterium]
MDSKTTIIPVERINGAVQTKALVQAVKRNRDRFPPDFLFQLTSQEFAEARMWSQSVTTSRRRHTHAPLAFTELGVAMLSSVLRSPRAIAVNIEIMRAFVQLRQYALTHEELNKRIDSLETKLDVRFKEVLSQFRKLIAPEHHKPTLGFGRKKIS